MLKKGDLPEEVQEQIEEVMTYLSEGEVEDAIDIIDELADEFPDSYEVVLAQIHVYRSLGINTNTLVPLAESCHAADPTDLEVWIILIEELAELGFFALAEMELELLSSSSSPVPKEICSEEFIKSIKDAASFERNDFFGNTSHSARHYLLYNLAEKAIFFDDYPTAKKHIDELLNIASDSIFSWLSSAKYHFQQSSFSEAIEACKKAISISPNYGEPYYILAKSELLSGLSVSKYPQLNEKLLEYGISHQAFYLILSNQREELINLYEKNSDFISSFPDASRFFECVAFLLFENNEKQRANSLWQFAQTLEPNGSTLAETHIAASNIDDPEIPYIFFGPLEFPYFFSNAIEGYITLGGDLSKYKFSKEELKIIPEIYKMILSFGDSDLVKISTSILLNKSKNLKTSNAKIVESMFNFCSSERLSASTRAYVAQTISLFGGNELPLIKKHGKTIPLLLDSISTNSINPFTEGTDEYFYFDILTENLQETSIVELESMCKSLFEKTSGNVHFGIELGRVLLLLGKFDEAETIISKLHKSYPKEAAVTFLYHESKLPQLLKEAKEMVKKHSNSKLDPISFREYQFLKSAIANIDSNSEIANLELDKLELVLPDFKSICNMRRSTLSNESDKVVLQ